MTILSAAFVTVTMLVCDLLAERWGLASAKDWDEVAGWVLIGFGILLFVAAVREYDDD